MTLEYKKQPFVRKTNKISSTSTIMTVTTIKEPNNVSDTNGADTDFFLFYCLLLLQLFTKNSLPITHTKTITIPPSPLPRMQPSKAAA